MTHMIEIECKYRLDKGQEEKLIQDAQLFKQIKNEDSYFDRKNYELTCKNFWLRKRNGRFEMKVPLPELTGRHFGMTQYRELETDEAIREELKLPGNASLEADLLSAEYVSFLEIRSERRSYRNGPFRIDLDTTDYGYQIAEIELMIEEKADRSAARKQITDFAESLGIDTSPVRGKILEYLFRYRPEHYQALVEAGVI